MLRLTLSFGLLFTLACASRNEVPTDSYGAEFSATEVLPATELLTTYPEASLRDTVRTTLRATVHEVCQAKGCWMTVDVGSGETMMVKFRDYGFFVPKDIAEREAILNGRAFYQITPVDELRHFARDAGKSDAEIAAIVEPRRELHFIADGVKLN
ncbi:DUF4920 domain-containing protein [Lewinella sp. JB7]|uniref:DUF4920 domain-containing protein n=1 Tax=Lewinella sp. JB7 TaxID=2962887 RepID=UPI0020C98C44|nr:DUF4920 domain-containing protein [Lewinella sp. JB7]MCP9236175.1 DUF4920 domain-containing protein [Lewinella sp. JB7]